MTQSASQLTSSAPTSSDADQSRRALLRGAALSVAGWSLGMGGLARAGVEENSPGDKPERLFFTSQGRTGLIDVEGQGLRYFQFDVPNQATWQPGPFLSDGKRVIFLSMEPVRHGPGKPFDEYYHQTPTHLWLYDLASDKLTEICKQDRLAPFYTPALLVNDDRLLVQVVERGGGRIVSMNLDGTEQRPFTRPGDGFPYGISLSRDGQRVAFHLAGPAPHSYRVWTSNTEGEDRHLVAGDPAHLYFGTQWSPDGEWVTYQDCHYQQDPAHDWSDVCIGRATGGEHRVLTKGQAMWFGATYGDGKHRGGGSNLPAWTADGQVLFPRRLPDSKVAWQYQPQRPDVDHFNRDYKPDEARGGTEICRIDPASGTETALTHNDPAEWDFRATQSASGKWIAFCRAATGASPSLWVMRSDGSGARELTRGIDNLGVDHPRWLPLG